MSRKTFNINRFVLLGVLALLLALLGTPMHSYAGSDTWTSVGILGVEIYTIAVNPNNPQQVLVGIEDNPYGEWGSNVVYRSTNGGDSWNVSNTGITSAGRCYDIEYDLTNTNKVYIATLGGVYKSLDGGVSWSITEMVIPTFQVEVSPVDGNTVYAGSYVGGPPFDRGAVWKSVDGGESWTNVLDFNSDQNIGNEVNTLAVAPSAPHVIYASSANKLFKSTNSGQSWQRADNGFIVPPRALALAVDPYSSDIVYLGSDGALFKTVNGGNSWTPISGGLGGSLIRAIAIDSDNQQIIYVGTQAGRGIPGVYRSTDSSGTSWIQMNEGMGSVSILSLAIDAFLPQSIYAGSTSSGLWKYTYVSSGPADYSISINNGALFTNQTNVELTLTAPPGTGQVMLSNDGGFAGATWESFTTKKPWTITSYGSYVIPRIVYAKFKKSGQISGLYQDDIILDVTSPTGTVQITGPLSSLGIQKRKELSAPTDTLENPVYLPLVYKKHRHGFRLVGLELSASDDVSGVESMLVSNDSSFTDAIWQTYKTSLEWWVYDPGTTTVYVKFRDRAGNESQAYSAATTVP